MPKRRKSHTTGESLKAYRSPKRNSALRSITLNMRKLDNPLFRMISPNCRRCTSPLSVREAGQARAEANF